MLKKRFPFLLLLLAIGCGKPAPTTPAAQRFEVVAPKPALAPGQSFLAYADPAQTTSITYPSYQRLPLQATKVAWDTTGYYNAANYEWVAPCDCTITISINQEWNTLPAGCSLWVGFFVTDSSGVYAEADGHEAPRSGGPGTQGLSHSARIQLKAGQRIRGHLTCSAPSSVLTSPIGSLGRATCNKITAIVDSVP